MEIDKIAELKSFLKVLPPVGFCCVYGSSLHPNNKDKVLVFIFPILLICFFMLHLSLKFLNLWSCFLVTIGFVVIHGRLYYWRIRSQAMTFLGRLIITKINQCFTVVWNTIHREWIHCGLYYSTDTVDCKCFYCWLHCWWGHAGRLQLAGPKRQAGGASLQDPGSGFKGSGSGVRIHDQWI
jgi:hypothetical protein